MDGFQVLYLKLERQQRLLKRLEAGFGKHVSDRPGETGEKERRDEDKVLRITDRHLHRAETPPNVTELFDPGKTPA